MRIQHASIVFLLLMLVACGGGAGGGSLGTTTTPPPPDSSSTADINLLFMGNSHTAANNLPAMVAAMLRAGRPGKSVVAVEAPGWMFLEERVNDAASRQLLASRNWQAVILQAQKYSSSGLFNYSTAEAEELVRLSKRQGAIPLMFPEWPRRGIAETQRIFELHQSIARKDGACLPPIPQAWDLALIREPGINLYAADGNHAAAAGSFLTALVIYNTLTNQSPVTLPELAGLSVDGPTQAKLRVIAGESVQLVPPRLLCLNEKVL